MTHATGGYLNTYDAAIKGKGCVLRKPEKNSISCSGEVRRVAKPNKGSKSIAGRLEMTVINVELVRGEAKLPRG